MTRLLGRVLAVRLDNDGDVLLTGPAVATLARAATRVDVLASPSGRAAAELLPGVDDVLVLDAPWSGYRPPPVDRAATLALVDRLAERRYDSCVIFTSFHQSPLPMALLARLAGIGHIVGTSVDYPGSLLDVRHQRHDVHHEVEAALDLAYAAGATPSAGDAVLRVRQPLPPTPTWTPRDPFVVVHPGASVPARSLTAAHARSIVDALADAGWAVVVTGGPGERALGSAVAPRRAEVVDATGRTSLAELAALLDAAACVVVPNTGPAHLAAAVGTPVVSLFSPVVPAERWAPFGVPRVVLGDQHAACAGTRARECPVPGHPCLSAVAPSEVVAAVRSLVGMDRTETEVRS